MGAKKEKSLQRQVKKLARDKWTAKMGNVLSIVRYTNTIAGVLGYEKKIVEFGGKTVEVFDLKGQGFEALLNELITKYQNSESNLDMYVKAAQSAAQMYRAVQEDAAEREAIQKEEGDASFDVAALENEGGPVAFIRKEDETYNGPGGGGAENPYW